MQGARRGPRRDRGAPTTARSRQHPSQCLDAPPTHARASLHAQVHDMVSEAISNFDGKIYYDGFVKILLAN